MSVQTFGVRVRGREPFVRHCDACGMCVRGRVCHSYVLRRCVNARSYKCYRALLVLFALQNLLLVAYQIVLALIDSIAAAVTLRASVFRCRRHCLPDEYCTVLYYSGVSRLIRMRVLSCRPRPQLDARHVAGVRVRVGAAGGGGALVDAVRVRPRGQLGVRSARPVRLQRLRARHLLEPEFAPEPGNP